MAFTKVTDPVDNITNQPNKPVISATNLKALFDEIGKDLKTYINDTLIEELESATDGNSGANNVGATPLPGGVATSVQGVIEELKDYVDEQLTTIINETELSPNKDPEIINARGTFDTLGYRLTDIEADIVFLGTSKADQIDLDSTNSEVLLKADKTYVDLQIASVVSGSPSGVYADLATLSAAIPAGNTNIYITLDNGHWNFWNGAAWVSGGVYQSTSLADGSVTFNILDLSDVPVFFWERGGISPTGSDDNNPGTLSIAIRTDYIKMLKGGRIDLVNTGSYRYVGHVYSIINQTWIAKVFDTSTDIITEYFLTDEQYVRVVMLKVGAGAIADLEIPILAANTRMMAYIERISELESDDSVTTRKIAEKAIEYDKLNLSYVRQDFWERGGIVPGTGVEDSAPATLLIAIRTLYIKVLAGSIIKNLDTVNYRYIAHIYASDGGSWIRRLFDTTEGIKSEYVIPLDSYVRIVILKNPIATILDSEILTVINQVRLDAYLERLSELEKNNDGNRWGGLKSGFNGDSITFGYFFNGVTNRVDEPFCNIVAQNLNMDVINYGISSSTIAVKQSDPLTYTPISSRYIDMDNYLDLVVIAGGTNDFYYSWTPIGTVSDTTTFTFYGALNVLCAGLLEKYPAKQILFLTPIKRITGEHTTIDAVNSLGITLKQYGNIIKEVCNRYSIPVLDLYAESGINPQILTQATLLIPDQTHPNQTGHNVMSNRITGFLKQL